MVREFLDAGLVDRLHVAIAPILLGGGVRLWDGLRGLEFGYDVTTEAAESGTLHITFSRKGHQRSHHVSLATGWNDTLMDTDTQVFAGLPVRVLPAALDWYAVFFGRPADEIVGDEAMWQVAETAWLFVVPDERRAGGGLITLGVADLEPYMVRWRAAGLEHEPVETYGNGVRHVTIIDPDGNSLSLASQP